MGKYDLEKDRNFIHKEYALSHLILDFEKEFLIYNNEKKLTKRKMLSTIFPKLTKEIKKVSIEELSTNFKDEIEYLNFILKNSNEIKYSKPYKMYYLSNKSFLKNLNEDIDNSLVYTMSPPYYFPIKACNINQNMLIGGITSFDLYNIVSIDISFDNLTSTDCVNQLYENLLKMSKELYKYHMPEVRISKVTKLDYYGVKIDFPNKEDAVDFYIQFIKEPFFNGLIEV